eukprot:6491212-Amphidinium_carterae.2
MASQSSGSSTARGRRRSLGCEEVVKPSPSWRHCKCGAAEVHRDTSTVFGQFSEAEIVDAANAWRSGFHGAYDGPEPVWMVSKEGVPWTGEVCVLHDRNTVLPEPRAMASPIAAKRVAGSCPNVPASEGVQLDSVLDGIQFGANLLHRKLGFTRYRSGFNFQNSPLNLGPLSLSTQLARLLYRSRYLAHKCELEGVAMDRYFTSTRRLPPLPADEIGARQAARAAQVGVPWPPDLKRKQGKLGHSGVWTTWISMSG